MPLELEFSCSNVTLPRVKTLIEPPLTAPDEVKLPLCMAPVWLVSAIAPPVPLPEGS
jgi:hypothetical protein